MEKLRSHHLFLTGTRQLLGKTLNQTRLHEHSVDKDELLNSLELVTVWSVHIKFIYAGWRYTAVSNFLTILSFIE